jgi:hypothetical protein
MYKTVICPVPEGERREKIIKIHISCIFSTHQLIENVLMTHIFSKLCRRRKKKKKKKKKRGHWA